MSGPGDGWQDRGGSAKEGCGPVKLAEPEPIPSEPAGSCAAGEIPTGAGAGAGLAGPGAG